MELLKRYRALFVLFWKRTSPFMRAWVLVLAPSLPLATIGPIQGFDEIWFQYAIYYGAITLALFIAATILIIMEKRKS